MTFSVPYLCLVLMGVSISMSSTLQIVAVCEFYVYTRHIEKKIVRLDCKCVCVDIAFHHLPS